MVRRMFVMMAGVLTVGLLGALGAGSAWGALSYPFSGQLAPAGGSFEHEVQGIAVDDANGQSYVAENGGVVNVFETVSGTQLTSWNGSAASNPPGTPAGSFGGGELAVAADNASGRVYVLDSTNNVVDVLDPTGGYVCQITGRAVASVSECNGVAGSDTPAHGFNAPGGIAVDQATGRVYVVDANNGVVDVFSSGGAYLPSSSLSLASIEGGYSALYTRAVAVDDANGHVYLADSGSVVVYEFGASGEFLAKWHGANTPAGSFGGSYDSVAADNAGGEVFVTDTQHGVTDVFDSSGSYVTQFGGSAGASQVTAVDQASGRVYVANHTQAIEVFGPALVIPDVTTGAASGVLPTGATLNGSIGPDGIQLSDCHFEYGIDTSYGQSAPCVPAAGAIPADSSEHAVSATLTGLAAGTTYHFRLAGANANGPNTGADAMFSTPPPPTIENASARNITSVSADLTASVDPNGYDTTYRFEWGTSTAYGTSVPVPDGDAGAGTSGVPVTAHLSGLSADTTYHWRVVANNANGTTTGVGHTFVYSTAGVGLPDNRAYEMVTPPQKNAALVGRVVFGVRTDFSRDGSRVIMPSIQCFAGSGSCSGDRALEGEPFEFTRTAGGWMTTAMAPSAKRFGANTAAATSADTGMALFGMEGSPGGEEDWWTRAPDGSFLDVGPVASPGRPGPSFQTFEGLALGATADFSHLVWQSASPVWPFDSTETRNAVYEYVGSGNAAPVLVGVSGGRGSTDLVSKCGTIFGAENAETPGSLSADGRTVFFTAKQCSSGSGVNAGVAVPAKEVWARIDESRSVLLSGRSPTDCASAACLGSPAGDAKFEGASMDGSRAFFTSTQQLTDNASEDSNSSDTADADGCRVTVSVNGCNLYEYDFARDAEHNPVAVSAGDTSGHGPRVQGVVAVSSDGSHVYFVAKGVLAGAANGEGQSAKNGAENLYVFEHDAAHPEGHTAFIAALPETDHQLWTTWAHNGNPFADVTPDGRFLVFTSHGALTADDTSVSSAAQVFRYDAQSGVLSRLSIGDGGFNDNGNLAEGETCGASQCAADASIVGSALAGHADVPRLDPTMSDDGSYVFFLSPVALTPGSLDRVRIGTDGEGHPVYAQNVYEYHDGRVSLISDGRDTREYSGASDVTLIGSDVTGSNVFFTTSDPLVAQDTDTQLDVYDARVCTVSGPCVSSPAPVVACQGEGCRGAPPSAPAAPVAASVTFAGTGNLASPPVAAPKKATAKKKQVKHKRRKPPAKKKKKKRGHKARRSAHTSRGGRS